jgi:hypothetical protein
VAIEEGLEERRPPILMEMGCFFLEKKVLPSALPRRGRMRSSTRKRSKARGGRENGREGGE